MTRRANGNRQVDEADEEDNCYRIMTPPRREQQQQGGGGWVIIDDDNARSPPLIRRTSRGIVVVVLLPLVISAFAFVGLGLFWNASMLSSNSSYAHQMPHQGFESPSLPRRTPMNGNATRTTDDIAILLERYEKRIAELENELRVYQTSKPNLNIQAGLQLNEANDTMATLSTTDTTTTKYRRTNKHNKNKIDKRHVHVVWEDSIKPSILFYQKLMNLTAQQEAEYNDEGDEEEDEDNNGQASHQDDKECIPPKILETRTSHPNCNTVHELSFTIDALLNGNLNYLISGGSNDVFRVYGYDGNNDDLALKVFSPGKRHKFSIPNSFDYSPKHYEIVDQDAFIMDQLTSSVYVQSVHGHCGFAITVPFASGGTLTGMLERKASKYNMSSMKRLQIAMEVAHGLADVHDLGLVHGDLTVNQYFVGNEDVGGVLQLADFNRAIFPKVNVTTIDTNLTRSQTTTTTTTPTACKIQLPSLGNPRSPEEYKDETQLTNAVDVWALGSILYRLLTGNTVWSRNDYTKEEVQERVLKGVLPRISNSILNSTDPVDKVMVEALDMCYTYDPSERPSARDISVFLTTAWRKYELGLSGEPSLN
jgi:serine/threonine protein kinase